MPETLQQRAERVLASIAEEAGVTGAAVEVYDSTRLRAAMSVRTKTIEASSALCRLLDDRLLAAVFAHELGHLEVFDENELRRHRVWVLATFLLALLASLGAVILLHGRDLMLELFVSCAGMTALLVVGSATLVSRRQQELACDRYSADLAGGSALSDALKLLYPPLSRSDRLAQQLIDRFAVLRFMCAGTHPSLNKRLEALSELSL